MNKLSILIIFVGLILCFFVKENLKAQGNDCKSWKDSDMNGNDTMNYQTEEQLDKRIYRPVTKEEVTHLEPDAQSNHLFLKELSIAVIRLDSLQNEQTKILEARIDSLEAKLKRAHIICHEVQTDPITYKTFWEISFEPEDSLEEK